MHTRIYIFSAVLILSGVALASSWYLFAYERPERYSDTEAGFEDSATVHSSSSSSTQDAITRSSSSTLASLPPIEEPLRNGRVQWSVYWQDMTPQELQVYGDPTRIDGPARVGIQAGHWQLENVPEELSGLQASSGAIGGGYTEQETVLAIAQKTKEQLEAQGIVVDLLPATVPVDYKADAFISIHADGSSNGSASGFKIAPPRKDFTGKADLLTSIMYDTYGASTGLREDPNVTRRMTSYYAFNWRRYDHAIHPQTPAVIVETGFMTNDSDRALLINQPEIVATGIANGVVRFLEQTGVLP